MLCPSLSLYVLARTWEGNSMVPLVSMDRDMTYPSLGTDVCNPSIYHA
jgi:hypothetical protein